MMPKLELLNEVFGLLTVKEYAGVHKRHAMWRCICECGNPATVSGQRLRANRTKSCGCLKKIIPRLLNTTHGLTNTSEYRSWTSMKNRCTNPNVPEYKYYGAKGITICDSWINSFETFYKDMGPKPGLEYSIERKENDKPYNKDNCVWATTAEQNRNKTTTRRLVYQGESLCVAEWSRRFNMHRQTLRYRLEAGWSVEKALTTKVDKCERKLII